MFDRLKENIIQEKKTIEDVNKILEKLKKDEKNRKLYLQSLSSLMNHLKILNNAVPELLKEWSPININVEVENKSGKNSSKRLSSKKSKENKKKDKTLSVNYVSPTTNKKSFVTLNKGDKEAFLKDLKLVEGNLSSLDKIKKKEEKKASILKPNPFAKFSNKFFRRYSEKLVPKFGSLSEDLKKANIRILLSTYISMALMSTAISLFLGVLIFGILLAFSLDNLVHLWIPIVLPGVTFLLFYIYPSGEASSVQKKISQELPFATIHMAAIAGSNIEPTKIFKIIAMSKEYQNIGTEIRKVISQVEVYGYDIVTSLKNVARRISNKKLAELFSGLATNIGTGGELKNYLEKKAENFLLDYRLERQKYSDLAGTFMDIYISILIAAPLVLMMMFIVMNVAGLGLGGLSLQALLLFSVVGIVIVNIIFIVVLNLKQPKV